MAGTVASPPPPVNGTRIPSRRPPVVSPHVHVEPLCLHVNAAESDVD